MRVAPFCFCADGQEGGGEMAKNKLDEKANKPKRGRGRPRKEPPAARGEEGTEDKKDGAGHQNEDADGQKPKKAMKALRKAVKDEIRARSEAIAEALVSKVANGDKRCTEMMFSLIEKKKKNDNGASRHGGLTAADLLGSEDQWESETYEAMEDKPESETGGRETEKESS
jgi:hypothetical protein